MTPTAATVSPPSGPGRAASGVVVMSFNIHYGADALNRFDLERTLAVIKGSGAEIIGLQEVDRNWGARSNFLDEATWLADRLDMHVAYGANLDERPLPGHPGNRQYGNAVLSAFPIVASENHLLDLKGDQQIPDGPLVREQRGLLEAVVDIGGRRVAFYCAHLDFGPVDRRARQVQEIISIAAGGTLPAILAGDLNAAPDAPELQPLFAAFADAFAGLGQGEGHTFIPADAGGSPGDSPESPCSRIDYLLTANGASASSARVLDSTASDHRAIVATVRWAGLSADEAWPGDFPA